jgi:hypothetical protein
VHVRLACDDLFTDRRARPASAVIEKQHFMVRKDFSHVYSMFAMCKEGVRIIPKGGAEFVLQHGGFYTLRDEDVIKVMDNDEVFLFFRTEEAGLTEKERWHRASIEFKHEGKREDHYKAKRRICGGLLAGLFRRRR